MKPHNSQYILYFMVAALVAFVGCTDNNDGFPIHIIKHTEDTQYTAERAMDIYDYQPERALNIVDSAVIVGNLSQQQGEYLRMKIYAWTQMDVLMDSMLHGPKGVRFESARIIGERLLEDETVKDSLKMQQDVLEVLIYVARHQTDTTNWFQRSRELAKLCHQQGAETEALRTEAELGAALCMAGNRSEGMAKLDSVITILDEKEGGRFNELDATIIAIKRKIAALNDQERYAETIPLARHIIERLNDYEQHPDKYHDNTYREPADSICRMDYICFYRAQAQSAITAAYAFLGEMGNVHEAFNEIEYSVRNATAREHIARSHALEQKILRENSDKSRIRMNFVAEMLAASVFVLLIFLCYAFFQNHKIRKKNNALMSLIEEEKEREEREKMEKERERIEKERMEKEREEKEAKNSRTEVDPALFQKIDSTIRNERLYANKSIQRHNICTRFNIRREELNQLLKEHASAQSFPAYINAIRLAETCNILINEPNKSVNEIAKEVGLTQRNLRHLFADFYGVTPSEYRTMTKDK